LPCEVVCIFSGRNLQVNGGFVVDGSRRSAKCRLSRNDGACIILKAGEFSGLEPAQMFLFVNGWTQNE